MNAQETFLLIINAEHSCDTLYLDFRKESSKEQHLFEIFFVTL